MLTKRRSFPGAGDYKLAMACVSVSESTANLKAEMLSMEVHKRYSKQSPGTTHKRTVATLETRWRTISRVTRKYLTADKLYRSSMEYFGECGEDDLRNIMALYGDNNKYKDKGVLRTPGPIKSMEAFLYLTNVPKFSTKAGCRGSSFCLLPKIEGVQNGSKEDDVLDREGLGDGKDANISMYESSASRPLGMRKKKKDEKSENGAQCVARRVDKMPLLLESAANEQRRAASLGIPLRILKRTPMQSDELRRMPDALRSDAASLFGKKNVKRKLHTTCRTAVDAS